VEEWLACRAGLPFLDSSPPPHNEAVIPQEFLAMFDWIENNFWTYVGILILILVALIAVLFVVRKNQDN